MEYMVKPSQVLLSSWLGWSDQWLHATCPSYMQSLPYLTPLYWSYYICTVLWQLLI